MTLDAMTVWSAFESWLRRQLTGTPYEGREVRAVLYLYPVDGEGAYRLSGPKLYWVEDASDDHFHNTDVAFPQSGDIHHVAGLCSYPRRTFYWATFAAFAAEVGIGE